MMFLEKEFPNLPVLELHCKYGFDGTHANGWKQKWLTDDGNDQHIFCSSIVPLELKNVETGDVVWLNPRPSSTRLCRPVKIQFAKETTELCKQEEKEYNDQIANLRACLSPSASIIFKLSLTMIDGKVNDLSHMSIRCEELVVVKYSVVVVKYSLGFMSKNGAFSFSGILKT